MSQFYRFFLATAFLALAWPSSVPAQTLDAELRGISPAKLVLEARETGDAARGAIVFFQPYLACSKCHSVGDGKPSPLGPDLTTLDKQTTDAQLVESVLEPSKAIRKGYEAVTVATEEGKLL
ncbi:MAG: hypothetical protein DWH88_01185, partial [Planctomycetota bacterium]